MFNSSSFQGQLGNLVVVLSRYEPRVGCYGRPIRGAASAQDLLSLIPVTWTNQTFGPRGESGVEVEVPITIVGPPRQCKCTSQPLVHATQPSSKNHASRDLINLSIGQD